MTGLLTWTNAHMFSIVFGLMFLAISYFTSRAVGYLFNRPAGLMVGAGILIFLIAVVPASVFLVSSAVQYHAATISKKPPTVIQIPRKKRIVRKNSCG